MLFLSLFSLLDAKTPVFHFTFSFFPLSSHLGLCFQHQVKTDDNTVRKGVEERAADSLQATKDRMTEIGFAVTSELAVCFAASDAEMRETQLMDQTVNDSKAWKRGLRVPRFFEARDA